MAVLIATPAPSRPVRLAQRCIEKLRLTVPIDLATVARACRVKLLHQPPGGPSADAMLTWCRRSDLWGIFVNPRCQDPGRRGFSVAHELGHYILHRDVIRTGDPDDPLPDPFFEAEANAFAGELLMPERDVHIHYLLGGEPERFFRVTRSAWDWRLRQLGLGGYR